MAILLCIDSSTNEASVALTENTTLLAVKNCVGQKEHASFLQPAIQELLKETGRSIKEVAAVAVTIGPGSYTGLRVGLASAKGLCFALQIPLITLGTLDVMALAAKEFMQQHHPAITGYLICPMLDARRDEVFTAVYDMQLHQVQQARALVLEPTSFDLLLAQQAVVFFGSGALKWRQQCNHSNALFEPVLWNVLNTIPLASEAFQQKNFASLTYATPFYLKEFYTPAKGNKTD